MCKNKIYMQVVSFPYIAYSNIEKLDKHLDN